jgi:DNA-binding NtrC family response regulator
MDDGATILIVDDDSATRALLAERISEEGYRPRCAGTGDEAMVSFRAGVDLVLLDYQLPDTNGFDLVRRMSRLDPRVRIVMVTGHADLPHAVEGMRTGLFDYLPKPVDLTKLVRAVRNALAGRVAFSTTGDATMAMIGESEPMQRLRRLLQRAADTRATVLVSGETGTGKGLFAHALHTRGSRASGPFMNVTCTALPGGLLESELFGHERGAFTDAKTRKLGLFELADGGTLFLDEVGDMEPDLQGKLLRVLEERTFRRVGGTQDIQTDIRLVAATNVDLRAAVAKREFREDLYYRLAVLEVQIPPLRERGDDVLALAQHFLAQVCEAEGIAVPAIGPEQAQLLRQHPWPGNVRELRNVIERAVLLGDGHGLDPMWLRDEGTRGDTAAPLGQIELPSSGLDMRDLERRLVAQALDRTGGNITRAASLLGMNRDQMRYRVAKFGLRDGPN